MIANYSFTEMTERSSGIISTSSPRKSLAGVFPLIPFAVREDQSADFDALAGNIVRFAKSGIHFWVMFGCTGEFYVPTEEEYKKCVEVAVQAAAGRIAIVVGTTWQNTP